jgi:hypothetical protein
VVKILLTPYSRGNEEGLMEANRKNKAMCESGIFVVLAVFAVAFMLAVIVILSASSIVG